LCKAGCRTPENQHRNKAGEARNVKNAIGHGLSPCGIKLTRISDNWKVLAPGKSTPAQHFKNAPRQAFKGEESTIGVYNSSFLHPKLQIRATDRLG